MCAEGVSGKEWAMQVLYWLLIAFVLLAVEFVTLGLTTIWFAGGALAAFLVGLIGFGLPVQVGVFVAVSVILVLFTRPLAAKYLNARTTRTNVDSLYGKTALVTEAIDNRQSVGMVKLDGVAWTARSADGTAIPAGATVRVEKVQGVKLLVSVIERGGNE